MTKDSADSNERIARLELLYQVSNVIHSTLDPQEALNLILREAVRLTNAHSGSVILINPTSNFLEIQASLGLPPEVSNLKLRVGEGITGWVARTGQPALVNDVSADPRYVLVRPKAASELAVPLNVIADVRGVLNVDSDRLNAFSLSDQELLEEFALQAAKVIHKTWMYEQIRLKAQMFESLATVSQIINSTLSLDEALAAIVVEAKKLTGCKVCALHMLDDHAQFLELKACHGASDVYRRKPKLSTDDSLLGVVVRRRKYVQVENVQTSGQYQNLESAQREGLVSLLSVPLIFDKQAIGTLSIYTSSKYTFSNEEIHILTTFAELSAVTIEKARLHEQIVDAEEVLRQSERLSALGLLAAEVAHEIRNPLTVLKMLFHSMNLEFPPDDPRAKDATIMRDKMDHMNKIVDQILNFARNAEPKLGPVAINALISDLALLVRHKVRNQSVQLNLRLNQNLPIINADRIQLEQAFLNLILNALQAMPSGGSLTIITQIVSHPMSDSEPGKDHVEVVIQDTGEGMNETQMTNLFSSLLSSTKREGTGLGLPLVSRVVHAHQGHLTVQSSPGQGTSITASFPIY